MADDEYRRLTLVGCRAPECASDAGTAGLCVRHYQRKRKHGTTEDRTFTCGQCGLAFVSSRSKKYCSQTCCWTAQSRKAGVRPWEEYKAHVRNDAAFFDCDHCGMSTKRGLGGASSRKGYTNKWCSMACRSGAAVAAKAKAKAEREERAARRAAIKSLLRILKARALEISVEKCSKCGCDFKRMPCAQLLVCGLCRAQAKREKSRSARKTPAGRRSRRAYKAKEKAIRRSRLSKASESIDPIRVFERDKWRCQLCGIRTPKRLRGSCEPDAPELDHVVALATGGTHTWGNVQCACRRCNGAKGSKAIGQLGLGFS